MSEQPLDPPDPSLTDDEKYIDAAQLQPLDEINVDFAEIVMPSDEDSDEEAASEPPVDEDQAGDA